MRGQPGGSAMPSPPWTARTQRRSRRSRQGPSSSSSAPSRRRASTTQPVRPTPPRRAEGQQEGRCPPPARRSGDAAVPRGSAGPGCEEVGPWAASSDCALPLFSCRPSGNAGRGGVNIVEHQDRAWSRCFGGCVRLRCSPGRWRPPRRRGSASRLQDRRAADGCHDVASSWGAAAMVPARRSLPSRWPADGRRLVRGDATVTGRRNPSTPPAFLTGGGEVRPAVDRNLVCGAPRMADVP